MRDFNGRTSGVNEGIYRDYLPHGLPRARVKPLEPARGLFSSPGITWSNMSNVYQPRGRDTESKFSELSSTDGQVDGPKG